MAGNPIIQTISSTGNTTPFAFDFRDDPFDVTIAVIVPNGVTATYSLEVTANDLNAVPPMPTYTVSTAQWITNTEMANVNATSTITLTGPWLFGRLNVASLSGGSIILQVVPGTTMGL